METANFQHTWTRCPRGTLDINFNGGFRCVPVASAGNLPLGGKNGKSLFSKLRRVFHKTMNGVGLGDTAPRRQPPRQFGLKFSCSDTACMPSPAYVPVFKQLQAMLNAAAVRLNISASVATDGVISTSTSQLFDQVADQLISQGLPNLLHVWERGSKIQDIAQNADGLVSELTSYVQYVQTSLPTMTDLPSEAPRANIVVTPSINVPGAVPASVTTAATKWPKWLPWVGGAAAAVLAVKLLK